MANVPHRFPLFLVKCSWRATALHLKVNAKDAEDAWEKAARQVKRMFGGLGCEEITVIREIE